MSSKRPTVPCGVCKGAGTIPLPDKLLSLLTLIEGLGECTVAMANSESQSRFHRTAMNRRFERLMALGLIYRHRVDGKWWYTANNTTL